MISPERVLAVLTDMAASIEEMKARIDDLPDGHNADPAVQEELIGLTSNLVLLSGQADALVEAIQHGA